MNSPSIFRQHKKHPEEGVPKGRPHFCITSGVVSDFESQLLRRFYFLSMDLPN